MNGNIWKVLGALAAAALGVMLAYDRKKNTIITATPVDATEPTEQETEPTEEQKPEEVNEEGTTE